MLNQQKIIKYLYFQKLEIYYCVRARSTVFIFLQVIAIEAKQIAEQQAKQADCEVLKAEKTVRSKINRAKGQAEAQKLQKLTLTPALWQKKAIAKWDGKFPLVMGGEGTLPFINIDPQNPQK